MIPIGMEFVVVDVSLPFHDKFIAAGPGATGYWLALLGYSRRERLDGFVPEHVLPALLAVGKRASREFISRLRNVGLVSISESPRGVLVLKYAEKGNETRAEIDARLLDATSYRAEEKKRKAEYRAKRRATVTSVPSTVPHMSRDCPTGQVRTCPGQSRTTETETETETDHTPLPPDGGSGVFVKAEPASSTTPPAPPPREPPAEPNIQRLGNFGMETTWWAEGISAGTGLPCRTPDRFESRTLAGALAAHARGLDAESMEAFVRQSARAYAEALRADDKVFMKSYSAWLDTAGFRVRSSRPEKSRPVPSVLTAKPVSTPAEVAERARAIVAELNAMDAAEAANG